MEDYRFRFRCASCGKFVPFSTEQRFIYCGSYGDVEPKEEEFLCEKCAKEFQDKIQNIEDLPRYYWQIPKYVNEKAKQLSAIFDYKNYKWKRSACE